MTRIWGRTNAGWFLAIPSFALSWFYLHGTVPAGMPYREGLTALLSTGTFLPMMLVAIGSAWEGGRASAAVPAISTSPRSPLLVAFVSVVPTLLTVIGMNLLVTATILWQQGVSVPFPDATIYLGFVLILCGVGISSWFFGLASGTIVAAPLMALLCYGLTVVPTLTLHPELRTVVGDRSGCCGIDEQVDRAALLAPIMFGIGLVGVSASFTSWLWRRHRAHQVAMAVSVLLLLAAFALPSRMEDVWARVPRSSALMCQRSSSSGIDYCVWPEQQDQKRLLVETGDHVFDTWRTEVGLAVPTSVTTKNSEALGDEAVSVAFAPNATSSDVVMALAFGVLGDPSRCVGPAPDGFDYLELAIWLGLASGLPPDDAVFQQYSTGTSVGPLERAVDRRAASSGDQRTWFSANFNALESCGD